mgnify:CR=1 FL=1
MNHTPGPWKRIAIGKRQVIASGHGWLVELPRRGEPETDLQARQVEADYDLMAAAPELLEALKEAIDFLEPTLGRVNSTPQRKAYEMARDAIARAEGKATV